MTRTNAKIYISRVVGGQDSPGRIALADDAIVATAEKWTKKWTWDFLKKDNANTRSLAGTVADAGGGVGTVVTVASTAGLNVGQGVSGGGLAAGATISSITSLTVFVLSSNATSGSQTFTFAAYIPVRVGIAYYYLPHDFFDFYSARLLTSKRTLEIMRDREVDRKDPDQESQQVTVAIGPASPGSGSGFTAADQRQRARLIGLPDTAENLFLKYYRAMDGAADPIDIPDDLLYTFLDDCKVWFLSQLNSNDPRVDILGSLSNRSINDAIANDAENPDEEVRMKSQMEVSANKWITRGYPFDSWGM